MGPLHDAYLLLIKAYVQSGKESEESLHRREDARLNYQRANELIAECLSIKALRHTSPEAGPQYPQKMIDLFASVRRERFGAFRVLGLHPPGATVLLDTDTLRAFPGDTLLGDVDLSVGPHRVTLRAPGHKDFTEEIVIAPGLTEGRQYRLSRRRSRTWWATVATGAVGVVGGTVALLVGRGSAPPEPLPEAPLPPSR